MNSTCTVNKLNGMDAGKKDAFSIAHVRQVFQIVIFVRLVFFFCGEKVKFNSFPFQTNKRLVVLFFYVRNGYKC